MNIMTWQRTQVKAMLPTQVWAMARRVIAGILLLASASTNVFADDCCRQQMVTGLNVFFWATKLKYFAQQIRRICTTNKENLQAPSLWTECTPCLRKGLSMIWLHRTETSARWRNSTKDLILSKNAKSGCVYARSGSPSHEEYCFAGTSFPFSSKLFVVISFKTVLVSTECWFCREPYCCSLLQVTLFGSSPQCTAVPGEIGLAIAISPKF